MSENTPPTNVNPLAHPVGIRQPLAPRAVVIQPMALENAHEDVSRLAGWPDVVDMFHENEYSLLEEFRHWSAKGYRLGDCTIQSFVPGDYHLMMFRPAGKACSSPSYVLSH